MTATPLHVTNGDSAAGVIRAAGISGIILPWRDVLHEGPVPAGLPLAELSGVRARFLASGGYGNADEIARGFTERDAALAAFRDHAEVVLWFEHDLYDQLQLAQILDFLASADLGGTALTLVCGDEYLGMSTPARLAERFPARAPVTEAQLALGEAAWNAFRSPDPGAISSLVAGDTSALPWMGAALLRHLEQFPSTVNGLSRSERQALEAIAAGAATVRDAYAASHHRREDAIWLGDSTFVDYLRGLAAGPSPLVSIETPPEGAGPGAVMNARVELTPAGRDVLEARADRIRLNGLDRWLGGVHLRGRDVAWRWDPAERRLVKSRP